MNNAFSIRDIAVGVGVTRQAAWKAVNRGDYGPSEIRAGDHYIPARQVVKVLGGEIAERMAVQKVNRAQLALREAQAQLKSANALYEEIVTLSAAQNTKRGWSDNE